ncbi:MAG: hypothetical protein M5U16_03110 [Hyphomicrobium sp.]|nr:hypothetical protein [Hyphomicrobium sp.]
MPISAIFMSSTRAPCCTLLRSQSDTERIMVTIHGLNEAARSTGMPERAMIVLTASYSVLDSRLSRRRPSVNMTSGADWAITDAVAVSDRSETSRATTLASLRPALTAGDRLVTRSSVKCTVPNRYDAGRPSFSILHRMAPAFLVAAASAMMRL